MARGRDAADVAFATTFGPNTLVALRFMPTKSRPTAVSRSDCASQLALCHIVAMTTYMISARADQTGSEPSVPLTR